MTEKVVSKNTEKRNPNALLVDYSTEQSCAVFIGNAISMTQLYKFLVYIQEEFTYSSIRDQL